MPPLDRSTIEAARATHGATAREGQLAGQRRRNAKAKAAAAAPTGGTWAAPIRPAKPCARCGTTGGREHHRGDGISGRTGGPRFGVAGKLCLRCYDQLAYASLERGDKGDRRIVGLLGRTKEERAEIKARTKEVREMFVIPRYRLLGLAQPPALQVQTGHVWLAQWRRRFGGARMLAY